MKEIQTPAAPAPVRKPFYKKWWFWVLVVIVILAAIGSSSPTPHKVGTTSTQTQPTTFKVGDQIKMGDTVLTVTSVNRNWKSANEFDTPSNPNDVYVTVSVSLQNQGTGTIDLSSFWDFKLEDATGVIHDQSLGGVGLNALSTGSLAAGGKTSGDILFEVPQNATSNMALMYQPLFSGNQPVKVELQ